MTEGEPVTIAHYPFRTAAESARLRLEAEGITVFLSDAEVVDMNWLLGNALGWIKLQVPAAEAERAAAILGAVDQRRLTRRWRASESTQTGVTTMADQDEVDPDEIDDLERQLYGLRLHIATIYRLLESKGIATPDEIQAMIEKVDAEDGASDEEFFGDMLGPSPEQP